MSKKYPSVAAQTKNVKSFGCADCSSSFPEHFRLYEHCSAKGHNPRQQYTPAPVLCRWCNLVLDGFEARDLHLWVAHPRCDPCKTRFHTWEHLMIHRLIAHAVGLCECGDVIEVSRLSEHWCRSIAHPNCPYCGGGFADSIHLGQHISMDHRDKVCPSCNVRYIKNVPHNHDEAEVEVEDHHRRHHHWAKCKCGLCNDKEDDTFNAKLGGRRKTWIETEQYPLERRTRKQYSKQRRWHVDSDSDVEPKRKRKPGLVASPFFEMNEWEPLVLFHSKKKDATTVAPVKTHTMIPPGKRSEAKPVPSFPILSAVPAEEYAEPDSTLVPIELDSTESGIASNGASFLPATVRNVNEETFTVVTDAPLLDEFAARVADFDNESQTSGTAAVNESPEPLTEEYTIPRDGVPATTPTVAPVHGVIIKCGICLGSPLVPIATMCGHIFCHACIMAEVWRQPRCPVCEKAIFTCLSRA